MSLFRQIIYYFSIYRKYIGRRLLIVFTLTAMATATEGLGIAMLLPLIGTAGVGLGEAGQSADTAGVHAALQNLLDMLGIGSSMVVILLFIAALFLLKGIILFLTDAYQSHLKSQLLFEIKSLMFNVYSKMPYSYYSKRNTGHFINIINSQTNGLIGSFNNYKKFVTTFISTIVYFFFALLLAWNFAIMAIVSGVSLLFLFRGLNNYVHSLSRKTSSERSHLNKLLVQSIQAFKYLVSTAQMEDVRQGVEESIGRLSGYMRSQGVAQALTQSLGEPVSVVFILMVIIIQVSVLEAPLTPIFVALLLFNRSMAGILGIQQAWQAMLGKIGSLEVVEKEFRRLQECEEKKGILKIGSFHKDIVMHDVSFTYGSGMPYVLQNISLSIPAKTTVAFVGESGAGKSTLVDLLTLLLRPSSGEIYIDGIAGMDVDYDSWRRQLAYVSQETVIFDDTIANNISMWKSDYRNDSSARERIEKAARQACADQFIRDLPDHYNTLVGDRGIRLSGGQRQRLFLARELYKNPRLLILDEATSALDSESERSIQQSIDVLKGHTTVVIIAHRLSTIKNADYIYVLDKGKIIECGAYNELLEKDNARFQRMVALQSL